MIYLEEQVPEYLDGQRSDIVASDLFPDYSRSRLQSWIKDGSLLVDGEQVRSKDRLLAGQNLRLQVQLDSQERWLPEDIPLDILFEDEHLLVVDKPVGMVVHPAAGNPDGTLLNAVLHHAPETRNVPRAGIVHRIDKDTSGLLVIAKTVESQTSLVRQLQKRTVKREYLCVAEGQFTAGSTVEAPVGRHPRSRLKMSVVANGKPAVTHYRIEERFFAHTLLRVQLETGRTHQIRVHMEYIKHPLVGDQLYGGRARVPAGISKELREYLRAFPRQALHAAQLTLTHPASGEIMSWQSPLPGDISQLLSHLRKFDNGKTD